MNYLTEKYVWLLSFLAPLKNRKGQGLVEYALILVLIAIVVIAAVTLIGERANNTFEKVGSALSK